MTPYSVGNFSEPLGQVMATQLCLPSHYSHRGDLSYSGPLHITRRNLKQNKIIFIQGKLISKYRLHIVGCFVHATMRTDIIFACLLFWSVIQKSDENYVSLLCTMHKHFFLDLTIIIYYSRILARSFVRGMCERVMIKSLALRFHSLLLLIVHIVWKSILIRYQYHATVDSYTCIGT